MSQFAYLNRTNHYSRATLLRKNLHLASLMWAKEKWQIFEKIVWFYSVQLLDIFVSLYFLNFSTKISTSYNFSDTSSNTNFMEPSSQDRLNRVSLYFIGRCECNGSDSSREYLIWTLKIVCRQLNLGQLYNPKHEFHSS